MTDERKVALVTGASRGIGAAIADDLGALGHIVIGTATTEAGAEKISQRLASKNIAGRGVMLNVTDVESIDSVLKTIIEVAQSRGAFKANELEAVGKTFNKLDVFLTTVQNQQVAESANAPTMPAAPAKDTPVSPADASAVLGA